MQSVTLFDKYLEGSVGYIIKRETTDLNMRSLDFIQVTDGSTTSDPITEETALHTLFGYINESDADVAYNLSGDTVYIFLKTATYAYLSATKFVIFGKRNAIPIGSYIDIPKEALELFINYAIAEAAQISGKVVPDSIVRNIAELEGEIV